jgi:hypothetical protein
MDKPEHQAPNKSEEICWLLDVRKYGIDAANELHPEDFDN